MRWSLPFLLSFLPLSGLAGVSRPRCSVPNDLEKPGKYHLKDFYSASSFLSDDWVFFSEPDPTNGNVNFQTKEAAIQKKLVVVENDRAILAVDDLSDVAIGGNRDSIRLSTRKTYSNGLFIADFQAMPHGCSVWPAYWTVGPNWPDAGEVDVIEGANNQATNGYTLHSGPGCSLPAASNRSVTGKLVSTTCTSDVGSDNGCGYSDPSQQSFGHDFNKHNGGVFAHLWDKDGFTMWRFFRHSIPKDITAKNPNPSQWGSPVAFFPSTSCDIPSHFFNHSLILDITLCGDFASATYSNSGCPGTCQQAVANAANFKYAKWKVNYISVYQT